MSSTCQAPLPYCIQQQLHCTVSCPSQLSTLVGLLVPSRSNSTTWVNLAGSSCEKSAQETARRIPPRVLPSSFSIPDGILCICNGFKPEGVASTSPDTGESSASSLLLRCSGIRGGLDGSPARTVATPCGPVPFSSTPQSTPPTPPTPPSPLLCIAPVLDKPANGDGADSGGRTECTVSAAILPSPFARYRILIQQQTHCHTKTRQRDDGRQTLSNPRTLPPNATKSRSHGENRGELRLDVRGGTDGKDEDNEKTTKVEKRRHV